MHRLTTYQISSVVLSSVEFRFQKFLQHLTVLMLVSIQIMVMVFQLSFILSMMQFCIMIPMDQVPVTKLLRMWVIYQRQI